MILTIPRCDVCKQPYSAVVGQPVAVSFSDTGVATIETDLGDLGRGFDLTCSGPECDSTAVPEAHFEEMAAVLDWIAEQASPSLDIAVPDCTRHPDELFDPERGGCRGCFFEEYPTQRHYDQRDDPRI